MGFPRNAINSFNLFKLTALPRFSSWIKGRTIGEVMRREGVKGKGGEKGREGDGGREAIGVLQMNTVGVCNGQVGM